MRVEGRCWSCDGQGAVMVTVATGARSVCRRYQTRRSDSIARSGRSCWDRSTHTVTLAKARCVTINCDVCESACYAINVLVTRVSERKNRVVAADVRRL